MKRGRLSGWEEGVKVGSERRKNDWEKGKISSNQEEKQTSCDIGPPRTKKNEWTGGPDQTRPTAVPKKGNHEGIPAGQLIHGATVRDGAIAEWASIIG
jgi:hypothetical protein